MTKRERRIRRFVRYMRRTLKNKIYGLGMIGLGAISVPLCDGDATFCLVMLLFGGLLFFAKENCIC